MLFSRFDCKLAGLVFLLSPIDFAWADCGPVPAAGANVNATCTGSDQTATYGDGSQTGTMTVARAANVNVSGSGYVYGFFMHEFVTYNYGYITVATSGDFRYWAEAINSGGNTVISNYGSILATADGDSSAFTISSDGQTTIINSGIITATASGFGSANAVGSYGAVKVSNSGSITATTSGSNVARAIETGDSASINNIGSITALASGSSDAVAILSGAVTVTNTGFITATASGGGSAYAVSSGGATFSNAGSITAMASSGHYAIAIKAYDSANLLNTGLISASAPGGLAYALNFYSTANTLTLGAGSKLIGGLEIGSSGGNTINFIGGNNNLTFSAGDLTGIQLGGSTIPYVVFGDRIGTLDPTSFAANASMLPSMTRAVSSLSPEIDSAEPEISSGKVMAYAPAQRPLNPLGDLKDVANPLRTSAGSNQMLPTATAATADGTIIWSRSFAGHSHDSAGTSLVEFSNVYYGSALGVDRPLNASTRYGVYGGAGAGHSKLADGLGHTESDLFFLGSYGRMDFGASYLKLGVQAGVGTSDNTRLTNNNLLANGLETATSRSKTWYVSPEAVLGHAVTLGRSANGVFSLTPALSVRYLYGAFGGYTESGGTDNLVIKSYASQSVDERASLKLSHAWLPTDGSTFRLDVTCGILGSQRIGGGDINGSLLGQGISFAMPGRRATNGFTSGAGISFSHDNWNIAAAGEYTAYTNASSAFNARAGVSVRF